MSPYLGGFEGFDLTNPRGQFGGERFHLPCSNLGLGDAILHPHHSTLDILSCRRVLHQLQVHEEREGTPLGVSSKGGTPFIEGSLIQEIGRDPGDSSTGVFIAGSWSSVIVHSRGFLCAI